MHTVHYLVVDVDGKFNESNEYYEGVLSAVLEESGCWYDWWAVGGRWEGSVHEELGLKRHLMSTGAPGQPELVSNTNIAPVWEYRQYLPKLLDRIDSWQGERFKELQAIFSNEPTVASEVTTDMFGRPIENVDEYLTRVNEARLKEYEQFERLITTPYEEVSDYGMTTYRMRKFCELVDGTWCPDSNFFDFRNYSARTRGLRELLESADDADIKDMAIIGVDFHY
jgi:hypothetical protein